MLFTVVQFLPLDEEFAAKTELCKKADNEESGAENDTDGDNDDEVGEFLTSLLSVKWNNTRVNQNLYSYYQHKYRCALINIITPPPEA
ncbi:MAG: hypothetical protein K0S12_264 [Bacteroidetes bacterium]|jgi:hypothetical protein|nr:hypothetical protein [Bacteroidota bacterium]